MTTKLCALRCSARLKYSEESWDARRCENGATWLRDSYPVCAEHLRTKKLKLIPGALTYDEILSRIRDQFTTSLFEGRKP